VECAFGEIDRRWGIFWKPLQGALVNHKYVIDSALRLHNFIIDYRNENGFQNRKNDTVEMLELNAASHDYLLENPFETMGAFSDEDLRAYKKRGRHSLKEKRLRQQGKLTRDNIRDNLARKGLSRPKQNGHIKTSRDRFNRTILL
jgi:hypothetical protein